MGPQVVQAPGGRVQGIELMACTSLFDDFGRFAPTYDETRTQRLEADTVIFAIGQEAELEAAREEKLAVAGAGFGWTGRPCPLRSPGSSAPGSFWPGRSSPVPPWRWRPRPAAGGPRRPWTIFCAPAGN